MRSIVLHSAITVLLCASFPYHVSGIVVPSTAPNTSAPVDPAQLSVSIEFFTFPDYTKIPSTTSCLANLEALRGAAPAIRIGGTTQDRATYDPASSAAVNYTVADPSDAPDSLTYGPSFFTLAAGLKGDVTIGFNRQLNNITNTGLAAMQAQNTISSAHLLAFELGNEPDLYSSSSPIAQGQAWNPTADGASQKTWFSTLSASVGNVFQGAVYLSYPSWSTAGLIPKLGSVIANVKTFSGHAYPQSACGGAATNLQSLMSHSSIVSFTKQFATEASAAHAVGKKYFLGETNSATCGGGGISPTFGAGLWVMDYVAQGAVNNIDRYYFHQGTIGNCAYCFWNATGVNAPYYGAYFVSEFFGSESNTHIAMLDDGSSDIGAYALYSSSSSPLRVLLYNSEYFTTGTRPSSVVSLSGLMPINGSSLSMKRMSARSATSRTDQAGKGGVTIGTRGTFDSECVAEGTQGLESVVVSAGSASVTVGASEAIIVYLS